MAGFAQGALVDGSSPYGVRIGFTNGVRFQFVDGAVEVVDVLPGTPAWNAGLVSGDRILTVDGIDVNELDPESFVETMTGPEGTDVEFDLEFDGDTGFSVVPVQVTRQFLSG